MTKIIQISFLVIICSITACQKPVDPIGDKVFTTPSLQIADVNIVEGDTSLLEVKISLTGTHQNPIFIPYRTQSMSAVAGLDFVDVEGGLYFLGDESIQVQSIFVDIIDDEKHEEAESFSIVFEIDSTVIFDSNTITITIEDNDYEYTDNDYPGYVTKRDLIGWTLIWSDEFGGNELNYENWTPVIGNGCPQLCGFGNNEKQYYRSENMDINNGLLTINALKENFGSNEYTSARFLSKRKVYYTYGRIDFRAKLPYSQGLWPALWMQGEDLDEVGWPERGEIDVMELRGALPNVVSSTVHYKNLSGNHAFPPSKKHTLDTGDYSTEFHVFSMIWNEHKLEFFVNDIRYNTIFFSGLNFYNNINPFLQDFYLLMNVAVGGNFGGNPDATTIWPQKMEVDYVRVYQPN